MKTTNRMVCGLLACLALDSPCVASAQKSAPMPKLSGIARIGEQVSVVLELPLPSSSPTPASQTVILHERERLAAIEVKTINLGDGSAELVCYGSNVLVRLDAAKMGATAQNQINLTNASLTAVVELYANAAGRTILLHPLVPATRLAITGSANDPAAVAQIFAEALTNHGIVSISDGEKFLQLVPQRLAGKIRPHSNEMIASRPSEAREVILPAGAVNLTGAHFSQVAGIYASLVGREFDLDPNFGVKQTFRDVVFKNHSALTTSEMIYAFDVQFAWRGVKMIAADDKTLRLAPLDNNP